MEAMEEDYSGGYGGRNNEDYEGYNGGYGGRNNGGKTMAKAMEEGIMEAMKEDYSGGYGGRNNGGKTMVEAMEGGK